MELTKEQEKGQKILHQIYLKAWTDESFKKSLISEPRKTLEDFFKNKIPNSKKIIFTDQSDPNCIYINLPVKPNVDDLELMSNELDNITGGMFMKTLNEILNKYN